MPKEPTLGVMLATLHGDVQKEQEYNNWMVYKVARFGDILRRPTGTPLIYHYGIVAGTVDEQKLVFHLTPSENDPELAETSIITFDDFSKDDHWKVDRCEGLPKRATRADIEAVANRIDELRFADGLRYHIRGEEGLNCETAVHYALTGSFRSRQIEAEAKTHAAQSAAVQHFENWELIKGTQATWKAARRYEEELEVPINDRKKDLRSDFLNQAVGELLSHVADRAVEGLGRMLDRLFQPTKTK